MALNDVYSQAQPVIVVDPAGVVRDATAGKASIATSQVPVGTTTTLIAAARTGRGAITVTNITGAQQVYLGGSGVTAGTGVLLPAAVGASVTIPFSGALYGIALTAAQTVAVLETY